MPAVGSRQSAVMKIQVGEQIDVASLSSLNTWAHLYSKGPPMTRALIDEGFEYELTPSDKVKTNGLWSDPRLDSPKGFRFEDELTTFKIEVIFADVVYWVHSMILMKRGDGLDLSAVIR